MNKENYLKFYTQTSMYTYLGMYENFARTLPNDIEELCVLQRMQTIHPSILFMNDNIKNDKNSAYGDMTLISEDRFCCEEDIFPTALGIMAELLRRDPIYSVKREAKNKIHILCRGNAILLAGILKAKGIPARVRNGFAKYHFTNGLCDDQWNTEYFDFKSKRWIMVDSSAIGGILPVNFDMTNIPKEQYLTGPEAWLGVRKKTLGKKTRLFNVGGYKGLIAAWFALLTDFNAIMNNEIPVYMEPKYLYIKENDKWKMREFKEEELSELDYIAELMLDIESNFDKLQSIYQNNLKYRTLIGATIWNKMK